MSVTERRRHHRSFGHLLGANGAHRPDGTGYFADFEVCAGADPSRRGDPQLGRIPVRPDHSDEGSHPAPACRGADTAANRRGRRARRHRGGPMRDGKSLAVPGDIRRRVGHRIVVRRHPHAIAQPAQPIAGGRHRLEQPGRRTVIGSSERRTGGIITGHPVASGQRGGQCRDDRTQILAGRNHSGARAIQCRRINGKRRHQLTTTWPYSSLPRPCSCDVPWPQQSSTAPTLPASSLHHATNAGAPRHELRPPAPTTSRAGASPTCRFQRPGSRRGAQTHPSAPAHRPARRDLR